MQVRRQQSSGRYVHQDDRIGANRNIVTDVNRAQYFCACSNIHSISDHWRTALPGITKAHRNPIADHAVIANTASPLMMMPPK